MKKLLLISLLLFVTACGDGVERKYNYIVTERGIISYSHGYCELGLLLNNDRDNILDENNKPIKCSGMVKITITEAENWGKAEKVNPYDGSR